MSESKLAVRVNRANPKHHLYSNNGTWWCHYTVHLPDFTKRRVRRSLRTRDLAVAQARRDAMLRHLETAAPAAGAAERALVE